MDSQAKVSPDKRDTLQLFQKVSQSDQKSSYQINKENMDPQISCQIQEDAAGNIQQQEKYDILKLTKQNSDKNYEFIVIDEEQLGIRKEFSEKIRDVYDQDDDVDTTDSVLQQLKEVCLNDLIDGVRQNQPESVPNIINLWRVKRHYEILDRDENEDIKIDKLVYDIKFIICNINRNLVYPLDNLKRTQTVMKHRLLDNLIRLNQSIKCLQKLRILQSRNLSKSKEE